jgi:hypothetical protein
VGQGMMVGRGLCLLRGTLELLLAWVANEQGQHKINTHSKSKLSTPCGIEKPPVL